MSQQVSGDAGHRLSVPAVELTALDREKRSHHSDRDEAEENVVAPCRRGRGFPCDDAFPAMGWSETFRCDDASAASVSCAIPGEFLTACTRPSWSRSRPTSATR